MSEAVAKSDQVLTIKEIIAKHLLGRTQEKPKSRYDQGYNNALRWAAKRICEEYLGHSFTMWKQWNSHDSVLWCSICGEYNTEIRRVQYLPSAEIRFYALRIRKANEEIWEEIPDPLHEATTAALWPSATWRPPALESVAGPGVQAGD